MIEIRLKAIDKDAWRLLRRLQDRGRARIVFHQAAIGKINTVTGDLKMLVLTDTQEVDLAIIPLDRKGKPAQVNGVPTWASSDPTIARVTPSEDGLSARVAATDNLGSVQIKVTADAGLGEGADPVTGILDLEIVSGKAASLGIIAGSPREQAV
jgi:hypothetical protein